MGGPGGCTVGEGQSGLQGRSEPPTSPAFLVGGGKQEALPCAPSPLMAGVVGAGVLMGGWVQDRRAGGCSSFLDLSARLPWGGARAPWRQLRAIVARCFWRDGEGTRIASVPGRPWHRASRTHPRGPAQQLHRHQLQWVSLNVLLAQGVAFLSTCCVLGIELIWRPKGGQTAPDLLPGSTCLPRRASGGCAVHESHSPLPSPQRRGQTAEAPRVSRVAVPC